MLVVGLADMAVLGLPACFWVGVFGCAGWCNMVAYLGSGWWAGVRRWFAT